MTITITNKDGSNQISKFSENKIKHITETNQWGYVIEAILRGPNKENMYREKEINPIARLSATDIMEDCKEEQITLEKGVQKATLIQQTIMSLEEINSRLYGINKRLEDLTFKTGLCSAEPDSGDTCESGDDTYTTRLLNNLNTIDTRLNFITDRITDLEKFI